MNEENAPLQRRNRARKKLTDLRYNLVAAVDKWYIDNNGTDDEKEVLYRICKHFEISVQELFNQTSNVDDLNSQEIIFLCVHQIIQRVIEIRNLTKVNPLLERRKKEAKKKQTANGRQRLKSKFDRRRAVIERHVKVKWEKKPFLKGNASGTAKEIAQTVQAELTTLGYPYDSLEKAVDAIRKQLTKINGCNPVAKTGDSVQHSS